MNNNKTRVFINGGEGTTGLRIADRLRSRADIELISIDPELRKDPAEIAKKINNSDITFFCLPDQASIEAAGYVTNPDTVIIDASTAHRTNPDWAYGLPELSAAYREKIINSKRIAVPGCHASGFISLVYPLVSGGYLSPDALITAYSISGYSGAGKKAIALYEDENRNITRTSADAQAEKAPEALDAPRPYALAQAHKHIPEMCAITGLKNAPVFSPIIADYYSGMLVNVMLHTDMLKGKPDVNKLTDIYKEHYKGQTLIKVIEPDCEAIKSGFLPANALSGVDRLEIGVCGNADRISLIARFDNLGKGASGAAIECMNLKLGLGDDFGLNA